MINRVSIGFSTALFGFSALFLASCSRSVPGVIAPGIEPVPVAVKLENRVLPDPAQRQVEFIFAQQELGEKDMDISVQPEVQIRRGAGVIIDIPEYERLQSDQKKNQKNKANSESDQAKANRDSADGSTSAENFSIAQQEFERALIGRGLNVLDRKKFEAKLRDARDAVARNFNDDRKQVTAHKPGYELMKSKIETQFKNGAIDQMQYIESMAQLESKFALGSEGGTNRDEDEMSDTAEVIRAALLGDKDEVKPDYLLQMRVIIPDTFPRPLSLNDRPELAEFFKANPEFSDIEQYDPAVKGSETKVHNAFPIRIQTPWHYAESESKLISIKTGSVLWIGSIRSQSYHIEKFTIAYSITRVIDKTWGDEATKAVNAYNLEMGKLEKEARTGEAKVKATYLKYQATVEIDGDSVAGYEAARRREIEDAQRAYNAACQALAKHLANPPAKATERARFLYVVSDPLITPDLRVTAEMLYAQSQRKEEIDAHLRKLLRKAAKGLIETLPIK